MGVRYIFQTRAAERLTKPTSNPLLLKAQSRQLFICLQQSHSTTESIINVFLTNLGDHSSVTKPSASLHKTGLFSAAATKGWAWCNHNAELMERTSALKNLQLLVGTASCELPKGIAGMDSLNKHVERISFRQSVPVCVHLQPKGWQPQF